MTEQTRSRYLEYLPAIYQEMPVLDRFLLPFEAVLRGFEDLLSAIDRYFAPADTEPDLLPWLATWVALTLDEGWDEAKQRGLIREAVNLYRERGTVQGLKRYLQIYTGLEPGIRECRWPGGMQIGISSQIGGEYPVDGCPASVPHDYYVVGSVDSTTRQPLWWYYRADRVASVEVGDGNVIVYYFSPGSTQLKRQPHEPATITRRDGLIHGCYILRRKLEDGTETTIEYRGSTVLVGEVELPYRFIVDVRVPAEDVENVELGKVRAIVELEKPAHTWYYLKLTPVVSEHVLQRGHYG
jgi:phage tail-like protein